MAKKSNGYVALVECEDASRLWEVDVKGRTMGDLGDIAQAHGGFIRRSLIQSVPGIIRDVRPGRTKIDFLVVLQPGTANQDRHSQCKVWRLLNERGIKAIPRWSVIDGLWTLKFKCMSDVAVQLQSVLREKPYVYRAEHGGRW